jgi:hypothetical protein
MNKNKRKYTVKDITGEVRDEMSAKVNTIINIDHHKLCNAI